MSTHESNNAQGDSGGNPGPLPQAGTKPTGPDNPPVFKHAPPKPDGDPWEILLKPMLEADTVRCDAWKDEVQNLLIFAGLFSAVVTAFVIESYKFLQPDPNDTVVGLLFHIANSLNNTTPLPPSVNPPSITTPFSQTSSSVRINVFWFLSLILSLTTVLIGTISLQWLREHQAYPNFSPKEKVAIFHMRSEALDAWYVPVIFSALPLLLQGALVLFLAGLIDFSLLLGLKIIIPVSTVIGLTLLFLGTTTVLPTFQVLFFFLQHSYKQVPAPCPFKSPQSHALRILCGYLLRLISLIFPKSMCYLPKDFYYDLWKGLPLHSHPFFPFLYTIWHQTTWLTFDREWLSLRDACHWSTLDNNENQDLFNHREFWYDQKVFPLSDITQCIIKAAKGTSTARYIEVFFAATVHCFQEISSSIWTDKEGQLSQKARCNDYFEQLHGQPTCSISKFLIYAGSDDIDQNKELTTNLQVFNQDQMFHFLGLIQQTHPSPQVSQYQLELWSHLISEVQALHIHTSSTSLKPTLLDRYTLASIFYRHTSGHQRFAAVADVLNAVFKFAAGHHISQDQSLNSLWTHSQIAEVLVVLGSQTDDYLQWAQQSISDTSNQQHQQDIDARYISIFKFVANHLNDEISNLGQNSKEDTPSILFYLASIFMWQLLNCMLLWDVLRLAVHKDSSFGQGLRSFLEALLQYRTWTWITGKNDVLETRFAGKDYRYPEYERRDRFSEDWWGVLSEFRRNIGLKAAEQGTAVIEGTDPNSHPNPSSQDEQKTANAITTPAAPSSPSMFPGVVNSSPASNASVSYGDVVDHNEVLRVDPQPPLLTRSVSKSDDHDEYSTRKSLLISPATVNHATATNEGLDPIANLPLAYSQPSSVHVRVVHAPDGNHDVTEATTQIPAPSPAPIPPPSGEVGLRIGPQEVIENVFGDEQAPIHAGALHVTIEVRTSIDLEQREVVEVADSGNIAPEDQQRTEDVVVRIDPPN